MTEMTKGPWFVGPHYRHDVESHEGRVCECGPMGSPRGMANAQAISALPDLIEACRLFVREYGEEGECEAVAAINAALAKAEGR